MIFLKEAVPVCPDHHLMNMGQVIETVDHLCETLPRIKARHIRRELSVMQRAIDEVKSETVDGLIDEVREQRVLIEKLQAALAQQQAALDQQQTIISSLHAQLAPFLASLPAPSFPSSLSDTHPCKSIFMCEMELKRRSRDGMVRAMVKENPSKCLVVCVLANVARR